MTRSDLQTSRPVLGVSCAVVAQGCVVLIQRGKAPYEGIWSLPGGSVEWGETVFAAGAREVHEETGIACVPTSFLTVLDVIDRGDARGAGGFHFAIVCVRAELKALPGGPSGSSGAGAWPLPCPVAASDARQAAWFALPKRIGTPPAGVRTDLSDLELTPRMAQVLAGLACEL